MTVYGVTVVKNEADIIETTLRHMACEVDRIIVGDNRSTDGTRAILDRLALELPLEVVDEPDPGHHQAERITRYAQQPDATWIVPFDADEIWYSDHGRIADILDEAPDGLGVLACTGWDHITRNDQPWSPWRRTDPQTYPKVIFRAHPDAVVHEGNHGVDHPLPSGEGPIQYRHFQWRDFDQYRRKIRDGAKAADAAGQDAMYAAHWRELAALDDIALQAKWLTLCGEGGLVFDPPPIRGRTVSVIVPTLDRADLLGQCVAAIAADDCQLIVEHDTNHDGFAAVCNRAAKQATGDVLVFLNDDTVPQPGWLGALTRRAGWGVAGSQLLYPDGTVQHSGVFLRRDAEGRLGAFNRRTPVDTPVEVPAVTGAALAVSRGVWDELGGFDEAYRNGYEDVDLCLRARRHGHRVFLAADSTVVHLESQSDQSERFGHAPQNIALLHERFGDLEV